MVSQHYSKCESNDPLAVGRRKSVCRATHHWRYGLLAAATLCIAASVNAQQADSALRIELHSDRHSDALPLAQLDGSDLSTLAPRSGRNLAYLRDEVRVSAPLAGGQLALLARQSATLVASRGVVALVAAAGTTGTPATSAQYDIRLRYTGFSGAGLAWQTGNTPGTDLAESSGVAPLLHAAGWHWQAGVQGLALARLVWRRVDGQASFAAGSNNYSFDLSSDYADDRQKFPFQRGFSAHGAALLFNAQLAHCGDAACFGVGVRDLGRLFWRGLPRQEATLSSSTQSYDADGYVIYKPLVQGRYTQTNVSQTAPATVNFDANWRVATDWQAGLRAEWLMDFGWLPAAQLQWRGMEGVAWTASWRVHERRLGLQAAGERWVVRVATDQLGSGAHSRELLLAWSWPFH